jgi:hypothetical protein
MCPQAARTSASNGPPRRRRDGGAEVVRVTKKEKREPHTRETPQCRPHVPPPILPRPDRQAFSRRTSTSASSRPQPGPSSGPRGSPHGGSPRPHQKLQLVTGVEGAPRSGALSDGFSQPSNRRAGRGLPQKRGLETHRSVPKLLTPQKAGRGCRSSNFPAKSGAGGEACEHGPCPRGALPRWLPSSSRWTFDRVPWIFTPRRRRETERATGPCRDVQRAA